MDCSIIGNAIGEAQTLCGAGVRRTQEYLFLDCVQFSDQAQIQMEVPEARVAFGFESKTAAKHVIKEIESLRNDLAHAQDIVTHHWAQIVRMVQRLDRLATGL